MRTPLYHVRSPSILIGSIHNRTPTPELERAMPFWDLGFQPQQRGKPDQREVGRKFRTERCLGEGSLIGAFAQEPLLSFSAPVLILSLLLLSLHIRSLSI